MNKHLPRLYYELAQIGARCVGTKKKWPYTTNEIHDLLVLACEMSRYDPRLLGILVEYFATHWKKLNPYLLRTALLQTRTPQTLGVIAEFVKSHTPDLECIHFFDYVLNDIKPASPQLYFIDLYPVGSTLAFKAASESLNEYRRWGFMGRERPIADTQNRKTLGHWDAKARQNILSRLLESKQKITISQYLTELHHTISRQQALKDLLTCKQAKIKGKGRGSYWEWRV